MHDHVLCARKKQNHRTGLCKRSISLCAHWFFERSGALFSQDCENPLSMQKIPNSFSARSRFPSRLVFQSDWSVQPFIRVTVLWFFHLWFDALFAGLVAIYQAAALQSLCYFFTYSPTLTERVRFFTYSAIILRVSRSWLLCVHKPTFTVFCAYNPTFMDFVCIIR